MSGGKAIFLFNVQKMPAPWYGGAKLAQKVLDTRTESQWDGRKLSGGVSASSINCKKKGSVGGIPDVLHCTTS